MTGRADRSDPLFAPSAKAHTGTRRGLESDMSHIKVKMIKGHPYLYQVRSERKGSRVVQIFEKYLGRAEKYNNSEDNMGEDLTTGQQPNQEAKEVNASAADWEIFRSEIYKRDNGICWACNEFVELKAYDLGHLVDRCNGGQDAWENLAVMHKRCNQSKPKHNTLEEAIIWKMRTRFLSTAKPAVLPSDTTPNKTYPYPKIKAQPKPRLQTMPTTIPENTHQTFISDNELKMEALRLIGKLLGTPMAEPSRGLFPGRPLAARPTNTPIGTNAYIRQYRRTNQKFQLKPPTPLTQEQLDKIKPLTICWIQGRPMGVPMWKVLPPPYNPEDIFSVRITPPGAHDSGLGGIRETLQIIGGTAPQDTDITFNIGMQTYHITVVNGKLSITFKTSNASNSGNRRQTVGMGTGQIPIDLWRQAKAQGISFEDFLASYN